jgi:hypothetical protein
MTGVSSLIPGPDREMTTNKQQVIKKNLQKFMLFLSESGNIKLSFCIDKKPDILIPYPMNENIQWSDSKKWMRSAIFEQATFSG